MYTFARGYLALDTSELTEVPQSAQIQLCASASSGAALSIRAYRNDWGDALSASGDWGTLDNPVSDTLSGPFVADETYILHITDLSVLNIGGTTYLMIAPISQGSAPDLDGLDLRANFCIDGSGPRGQWDDPSICWWEWNRDPQLVPHIHPIYDEESPYVNFLISGVLSAVGAHEHGMAHTHDITLPPHTHDFEIQDHIHELEYGINEGGMPATVRVALDGVTIPSLNNQVYVSDYDLLPFVAKDSNGRINEGWHTIAFTSATNGATGSVRGTVFSQRFLGTELT